MMILSQWIPGNSMSFYWSAHPSPMDEIIDLKRNRRLMGLRWRASAKPRRKPKHIWIKRAKDGHVYVAPGVEADWGPLR